MQVPPPSLGMDLVQLLDSKEGTDITFKVRLPRLLHWLCAQTDTLLSMIAPAVHERMVTTKAQEISRALVVAC